MTISFFRGSFRASHNQQLLSNLFSPKTCLAKKMVFSSYSTLRGPPLRGFSLRGRCIESRNFDRASRNSFSFSKVFGCVGRVGLVSCFSVSQNNNIGTRVESVKSLNRKEGNFSEARPANIQAGEIKIAFLNFRVQRITDDPGRLKDYPQYEWQKRRGPIWELINKDRPDILGFCEVNFIQLSDLFTKLPGYTIVGYNRHFGEVHSIEDIESYIRASCLIRTQPRLEFQEFVGLIIKQNRLGKGQIKPHILPKSPDVAKEERERCLIEVSLDDLIHKSKLKVLVTHFDHISSSWRKISGAYELGLIREIEKQRIPWFSLGDRNWFFDACGESCYQEYNKREYIADFRDGNSEKHSGPYGSFPAHLGEKEQYTPKIIQIGEKQMVDANMVDVCFRSRNLVEGVCSYTYTGEFNLVDHSLRSNDNPGDLSKRNFISDHYYVGGIFKIKKPNLDCSLPYRSFSEKFLKA